MGNETFDESLLERAETLLSAMDDDRGGDSAVLELKERYPEKQVRVYDLEGTRIPTSCSWPCGQGKGGH